MVESACVESDCHPCAGRRGSGRSHRHEARRHRTFPANCRAGRRTPLCSTTESDTANIPTADLVSLELSRRLPTADAGQPLARACRRQHSCRSPNSRPTVRQLGGETANSVARHEPQPIAVPLDQVRAVRLQPLDPASLAAVAGNSRAPKCRATCSCVIKRGGKSLDYLEGVIGEVTADEVEFTLDGKTVQGRREQGRGLDLLSIGQTPSTATPQCVLVGKDGLRISASSV